MPGSFVEITPTVDTAIYASGDRVGSIQTILGANEGGGRLTTLQGLVVVDKSKQKSVLTLFFFDELPAVASADQAAADITDAEMVDKCLGYVAIAAADYRDLANNSTATVKDINLYLKPKTSGTLYAVLVSGGTPTYTSTSDLCFKYTFEW